MQWDLLVPAVMAHLNADAQLGATLGGAHIYPAQSARPVRVPSVEYLMTGDVDGETVNRITVQFDYWARGHDQAAAIERRLRALHWDVHRAFDGVSCGLRFEEGHDVEYPAEPGVLHRVLVFTLEAILEKYHPTLDGS